MKSLKPEVSNSYPNYIILSLLFLFVQKFGGMGADAMGAMGGMGAGAMGGMDFSVCNVLS